MLILATCLLTLVSIPAPPVIVRSESNKLSECVVPESAARSKVLLFKFVST